MWLFHLFTARVTNMDENGSRHERVKRQQETTWQHCLLSSNQNQIQHPMYFSAVEVFWLFSGKIVSKWGGKPAWHGFIQQGTCFKTTFPEPPPDRLFSPWHWCVLFLFISMCLQCHLQITNNTNHSTMQISQNNQEYKQTHWMMSSCTCRPHAKFANV